MIYQPQFLGSLLENKTSNAVKLEEELMSTRYRINQINFTN